MSKSIHLVPWIIRLRVVTTREHATATEHVQTCESDIHLLLASLSTSIQVDQTSVPISSAHVSHVQAGHDDELVHASLVYDMQSHASHLSYLQTRSIDINSSTDISQQTSHAHLIQGGGSNVVTGSIEATPN
ncbi:hypothetical protein V6N13_071760 [Hibiscus sabdariffa]